MDQTILVDKLRILSNKIIEDYQSVSLIMLLGNNEKELTTSFDFIISATWLNDLDQDKGMDIVLDYIYDNLSIEDIEHISRVTIIHTKDFIVQDITKSINVTHSIVGVIECQFGDLIIPYSIIFESCIEDQ